MPRQTQTYPRTLISLLQLKDSRSFDLEDNFRGSVELIDILGSDRITTASAASATVVSPSTTNAIPITVPEGQYWIMVAAGGFVVADAVGDVMRSRLLIRRQDRPNAPIAVGEKVTATLVGERAEVSIVFPRPMILLPGDQIVLQVLFSSTGGPTDASVYSTHYRFGPESLGSAL